MFSNLKNYRGYRLQSESSSSLIAISLVFVLIDIMLKNKGFLVTKFISFSEKKHI